MKAVQVLSINGKEGIIFCRLVSRSVDLSAWPEGVLWQNDWLHLDAVCDGE